MATDNAVGLRLIRNATYCMKMHNGGDGRYEKALAAHDLV